MYIILMRHGEAVPQTDEIPNKERSLTPKGMRQARRASRILGRFLKENPIRIYTSPYVRTRQTAGILAELQGNWQIVRNHLIQDGSPIALVSHHPFLQSYLLSTCSAAIKFDLAGIAVIDYDLSWNQGKLIGYFTSSLKQLKKEN